MRIVALILCLMAAMSASCGSRAAHDASTISIEIGSLSPVEVGAVTPSKKFIFMYSGEFRCRGTTIKNGRVSIEAFDAVGYYWDPQGQRLEVPVFGEVGVYTIYVSDNLETETENSSAITKEFVRQKPFKTSASLGGCKAT